MSNCSCCRIVAGEHRPPGGVILRSDRFVAHGIDAASPLRGWIVLTSARHVRGVYDFNDAEWTEAGPILGRIMRAQREELGAEHVYLFAIGDAVHHAHLHLVPRFADTPARLQGRGAFDGVSGDHLPPEQIERAVDLLRRALNE